MGCVLGVGDGDAGDFFWYTLQVKADTPDPERTIQVSAQVRSAVAMDIVVSNPMVLPPSLYSLCTARVQRSLEARRAAAPEQPDVSFESARPRSTLRLGSGRLTRAWRLAGRGGDVRGGAGG